MCRAVVFLWWVLYCTVSRDVIQQFFQDGMQTFVILMLPWASTFPQASGVVLLCIHNRLLIRFAHEHLRLAGVILRRSCAF